MTADNPPGRLGGVVSIGIVIASVAPVGVLREILDR